MGANLVRNVAHNRIPVVVHNRTTSRTQLFRKLWAITDKTVSGLLRDYRMQQARELLRNERYNVSEVMCLVGINSPSYFARTFREYYGISPSEYHKKRP